MAEKILKRLLAIILGLAWGAVSFFWLGYSVLTLGNFMEEPGSLDYVAEGESMRIFGLLGCILYIMVFAPILFFLYKQKRYLYSFLASMILGGIIPGIYVFVIRWQKENNEKLRPYWYPLCQADRLNINTVTFFINTVAWIAAIFLRKINKKIEKKWLEEKL